MRDRSARSLWGRLRPVLGAAAVLAVTGCWAGPGAAVAFADACPNASLRVGPSAALPDCRAYEQVTPVSKEASSDMFPNFDPSTSTGTPTTGIGDAGGGRVLLSTHASFGPNPDAFADEQYVFTRSPSGWSFTGLNPPGAGDNHYTLAAGATGIVNPSLTTVAGAVAPGSGTTLSPTTPIGLIVGAPGGPYTTVATPTAADEQNGGFGGGDAAFAHLLFESYNRGLAPGASGQVAGNSLYEWTPSGISLVNVLDSGALTSPCGASLGAGLNVGFARNAVSSDGSRVFFTSPDVQAANSGDPSCDAPTHLYVRLNGTETAEASAPAAGVHDPDGFQPVAYVGASTDGSKVFFVTKTELTADDTTHDFELYQYDTAHRTLTRVSRGSSGNADGHVEWAIVSDDGSTVYFTAESQLAPGSPAPPAGDVDLYRYDTASGSTRFIATVAGTDQPVPPEGTMSNDFGGSFETSSESNWYTTPDGRFLLFSSSADLTGYDPGTCTGPALQPECHELYRYDAGSHALSCVSCPGTSPATGDALFAAQQLSWDKANGRPPRPMSDDGSYVFFDSPEALVPRDSNGRIDVYEWHGGTRSLLSSGTDASDSLLVDSSADGSNVFIGTHAQLAPTDTDFEGDLYDVRIDGGFPAPPSSPGCSGEACQGPLSPGLGLPTIASVSFAGPGDTHPPAAPTLHVLSRTVRGGHFIVRVRIPAAGWVTIRGAGVRTVHRRLTHAGTYRLRVGIRGAAARRLRHGHRARLRIRISFDPSAGGSSATSLRVTARPRSARRTGRAPR